MCVRSLLIHLNMMFILQPLGDARESGKLKLNDRTSPRESTFFGVGLHGLARSQNQQKMKATWAYLHHEQL